MAGGDKPRSDRVAAVDRANPSPHAVSSPIAPAPWLAPSVDAFRLIRRRLVVIRQIRAVAFGGVLVFAALLALLLRHAPDGQGVLLALALFGLPVCMAAWLVAELAHRRLGRTKNHIEARVYDAGMHIDDQGRVLTDNPHPVPVSIQSP